MMAIGIGCLVAFGLIGSHVAADGFLREPFALLPLGWLLIVVGGVLALGGLFFRRRLQRAKCRPGSEIDR